jgi:hypothetical protein
MRYSPSSNFEPKLARLMEPGFLVRKYLTKNFVFTGQAGDCGAITCVH